MTRLYILVEGQTEEEFVREVLGPALQRCSVWTIPIIVATRRDRSTGQKSRGGGHWKHWETDLRRLVGENPGPDVRFTTLFDLYGLPGDFPDLATHGSDADTNRRAGSLEQAMASVINDRRFYPYLQRHEFEALVLACLDQLADLLADKERAGVGALRKELGAAGPEDVNDGEKTAPSKRLAHHVPGYDKSFHGPFAIAVAGLPHVREKCPRFNAWLCKLEALSGSDA